MATNIAITTLPEPGTCPGKGAVRQAAIKVPGRTAKRVPQSRITVAAVSICVRNQVQIAGFRGAGKCGNLAATWHKRSGHATVGLAAQG